VLLVEAVEESANVAVLAENTASTLHGTDSWCHVSPLLLGRDLLG
jgi:hypothetical protein